MIMQNEFSDGMYCHGHKLVLNVMTAFEYGIWKKLLGACMVGLMCVMLAQEWEKGSLREKRLFGGRDYREIYYWVQKNFLLTMYN